MARQKQRIEEAHKVCQRIIEKQGARGKRKKGDRVNLLDDEEMKNAIATETARQKETMKAKFKQ